VVIIDTSAWVEYFRKGHRSTAQKVEDALRNRPVGVGDLIYCEVMQGLYVRSERELVSAVFQPLGQFEMVGFQMARLAAGNYRLLRNKGVTVRRTIDVLIGTFCAEHGHDLIHHDRDFDLMAPHIGLKII
jgi:predicted nucleic acid-binding protein